jgi:hypothetical protein
MSNAGSSEPAQTAKEQQDTPGSTQRDQKDGPSKSQPPQESQTYRQIAATHIDTLSKINGQLPKLLAYFAAAISQLTNNPVETSESKDKPDTPKERQQALWVMTIYVGACIKQIREELVEQINDLEQYGVIPAKSPKHIALPGPGQAAAAKDPEAGVVNNGYGDFDVGVLNARAASGHVGEEDVLDRVKTMVEEFVSRGRVEAKGHGDEMAVD